MGNAYLQTELSGETKQQGLRVAMIGHKRIPTREGGVEIVVEELSVRMVEKGLSVDVYNRKDRFGKKYKQPKLFKNVRIIQIPTFRPDALNAFVYSVLASIRVLFGKYDCIHYHAEGPSAMLWIPKLFGKKVVCTIHGLDWQRSKWGGFSAWYLRLGERIAAKFADEIIVLSKNVQRYFRETYGRNTHYIPNSVEMKTESYPPRAIKTQFGLEKDGYILFLARIVPEKGLHYLIEAYKNIDTDKKLVIAGGLDYVKNYTKLIMSLAEGDDRIIFTDFVRGEVLDELFDNCFIYVLPSDIEGMAISLLECLSYSSPCLVSDIPENIEVVGELMPTFEHGNVKSLERELRSILDGNRPVIRDRSLYADMLKRYKWDEIVEHTIDLYKSYRLRKRK